MKNKKIVPSEDWTDLKNGEHSYAFTVAHTLYSDVLDIIFQYTKDAAEKGLTQKMFADGLKKHLIEKGWYGRYDKNIEKDEKYLNWRLKVIYQWNLSLAYLVGRERQMLKSVDLRPIWVWSAIMDKRTRPSHAALHGRAFRYDDPFWQIYNPGKPPCRCTKYSLSEDRAQKRGTEILESKADGSPPDIKYVDPKSGLEQLIDWNKFQLKEFRYNPCTEIFAPDFSKYQYLKNYRDNNYFKEKSPLHYIKEDYQKRIENYEMSQGEWDIWSQKVLKEGYKLQNINNLLCVLKKEIYEKIDIDPKLMIMDKDLKHSVRQSKKSQKPKIILSDNEIKATQKYIKNPDFVLKEKYSKNEIETYHFVVNAEKCKVLRFIFKKRDRTSLQFVTCEKVDKSDALNKGQYDFLYEK